MRALLAALLLVPAASGIAILPQDDAGSGRDAPDTPTGAIAIAEGAPVAGRLAGVADTDDWYAVTLAADRRIDLGFTSRHLDELVLDLPPFVELSDPEGNVVAAWTELYPESAATFVTHAAGEWKLHVRATHGDWAYAFTVRTSPATTLHRTGAGWQVADIDVPAGVAYTLHFAAFTADERAPSCLGARGVFLLCMSAWGSSVPEPWLDAGIANARIVTVDHGFLSWRDIRIEGEGPLDLELYVLQTGRQATMVLEAASDGGSPLAAKRGGTSARAYGVSDLGGGIAIGADGLGAGAGRSRKIDVQDTLVALAVSPELGSARVVPPSGEAFAIEGTWVTDSGGPGVWAFERPVELGTEDRFALLVADVAFGP